MCAMHQALRGQECPLCCGLHNMRSCRKYLQLDPMTRLRLVARYTMCANCLSPNHVTETCPQLQRNFVCEQRNQTLNHNETVQMDLMHHQEHINKNCVLCGERHNLRRCKAFLNLRTTEERLALVLSHKLCANCMLSTHTTESCQSPHRCRQCDQKHHTLLHQEIEVAILIDSSDDERAGSPLLNDRIVSVDTTPQGGTIRKCVVCSGRHHVISCPVFRRKNPANRLQLVLRYKICANCLTHGHLTEECRNDNRCRVCDRKHHTLIHHQQEIEEKDNRTLMRGTDRVISESNTSEANALRICQACGSRHHIRSCKNFLGKTQEDRLDVIVKHKLCANCFSSLHATEWCQSKYRCRVCDKKHHTLIHQECNGADSPNWIEDITSEKSKSHSDMHSSDFHYSKSSDLAFANRQTNHLRNREREILEHSAEASRAIRRGSLQKRERESKRYQQRFQPYS